MIDFDEYALKKAIKEADNEVLKIKKRKTTMIKKLYAVYDKQANTTQPVYEQVNDLVAIRDFSMLCKNEKVEMIRKFPDDYCLMCLGTIDTDKGTIVSEPKVIAEAREYVTE